MGIFDSLGMSTQVRPLHRITSLRDDPARAWLSMGERWRIDALGWFVWVIYLIVMWVLRRLVRVLLFVYLSPIFAGRASFVLVGGLAAMLAPGVRRSILRFKSARVEKLLRVSADSVAADDWGELAAKPDGTIVSVVGWVRGRLHVDKPIGGENPVGVALPCQHTFPGVFESLHDFDVVDEEGRSLLVQVRDGRIFGTPNVALDSHELRHLCAALDVPSGATPSGWHVHSLRDGDPVLIVGAKQDVIDPDESGIRGPTPRASLASAPPHPLLIFSIPAERRQV